MGCSGISSFKLQKRSHSICIALASAVLEWLLICMLLIDAIFSYLITIFARHWELQTPCLLCSRLDHILGSNKFKSCWDLVCRDHKLEISSLVYCHAHNKLVDVHGMCETCLFSFATINKSNAETYRLLVGKLGEGSCTGFDEQPLLKGHASETRKCSCCDGSWVPQGCGLRLMQINSVTSDAADLDFLDVLSHDIDDLTKRKRSVSVRDNHQRASRPDPLSHVGYSELKINFDTESEDMVSEDEEKNVLVSETNIKEEAAVGSEKLNYCTNSLPNYSGANVIQPHDFKDLASEVPVGHGLEELNWQQAHSADLPAQHVSINEFSVPLLTKVTSPQLNSLNVVPSSPATREIPEETSEEKVIAVNNVIPSPDARDPSGEASKERFIQADDILVSSHDQEIPVEQSEETMLNHFANVDPSTAGEEGPVQVVKETCAGNKEEAFEAPTNVKELYEEENQPEKATEAAAETNPVPNDIGLQVPSLLDLSDAYKLAVGTKGRQLSGVLAEQWTRKDSSRISEDLKLLLSQLSAVREQSVSPRVPMSPQVPVSPKLSINSDDSKTMDSSSIIGMQILQNRVSLERNESGLSLDGTSVGEIEGESVVDRLRRQVEHDKKLMSALYKELEEERSASSIAANQAMAMITRLQEEKATLHMEALQCLRMMEEQAEYDSEALQKATDLLTEREKEIEDLDAELEFYRRKFPNQSILPDTAEDVSDMKLRSIRGDPSEASFIEDIASAHSNTVSEKPDIHHKVADKELLHEVKNQHTVSNPLLDFEDERVHMPQ